MRRDVRNMIDSLDTARHASRDQPDGPSFEILSTTRTGRRGRPRKEINAEWLARMSQIRKKPGISTLVGVSSRTVRRRMLEYGLSSPGIAPVQRQQLADGSWSLIYNSIPALPPRYSDAQVDAIVASHLEIFPNFGRSMLVGSLLSSGQHLTRKELRASYDRLQGGPSQTFSDRRIHRRAYHVAGPNSLWHHDGQHGGFCSQVRQKAF
jgi:hypothetical protein